MEIFASFLEYTDEQVGRLVEGLEKRGLRENTQLAAPPPGRPDQDGLYELDV